MIIYLKALNKIIIYDFTGRWFVQDPLQEKYYPFSSYAYCVNNPLRFVDPNGMDWYSYEEKYMDENDEEQTRTQYKYVEGQMSKKEIKAGGYTHLGKTYTTGNNYYSLFGHKMDLRTQQGQVYQKIDEAVIAYGNWKEREKRMLSEPWPESINLRYIDVSLNIKTNINALDVEYEGSLSGIYNLFTGKNAMMGRVEYLFDGKYVNGKKVPFQWHGFGFGKATSSNYWLNIVNGTKATDISNNIIQLEYAPNTAAGMLKKFYELFPNAK